MRKTIFLALCLILCGYSLYAWEFVPALDSSGQFTYPSIVSNDTSPEKKLSGSSNLAASCMFNTDFLKDLWFIPTLTADYSNTAQPLNVNDQKFLFQEWLDVYFSYGVNYSIMKEWELRLRGFARTDFSKQTKDEIMGKGLYDYIDSGFYLETMNKFQVFDAPNRVTAGFKYIDRRFRNYTTLLSQAQASPITSTVGDTPDTYSKEKDNIDYNYYASDEISLSKEKDGWKAIINFSFDNMPYFEQRLIKADGTFGSGRRIDQEARLTIDFPYSSQESGVDIQLSQVRNMSNQAYYDTLNNTDMSDDVYMKGFYDSWETTGKVSVSYAFPWQLFSKYRTISTISFMTDWVNYDNRLAKSADGSYKLDDAGNIIAGKQKDTDYSVSLDLKQNITQWWKWFFNFTFSRYNSNMKYESAGLYNYTYITVSLGTAANF